MYEIFKMNPVFYLSYSFYFLLRRKIITPIITTAAAPRRTNGRIGVLSPVETAPTEFPLVSVDDVSAEEPDWSLVVSDCTDVPDAEAVTLLPDAAAEVAATVGAEVACAVEVVVPEE